VPRFSAHPLPDLWEKPIGVCLAKAFNRQGKKTGSNGVGLPFIVSDYFIRVLSHPEPRRMSPAKSIICGLQKPGVRTQG